MAKYATAFEIKIKFDVSGFKRHPVEGITIQTSRMH
jgi:hypothetical protein